MSTPRLKTYYPIGTLQAPVVPASNNAILGTFVLTSGPTVAGTPDKYGNVLKPNTASPGDLVDYAITATFVPSVLAPAPAAASNRVAFFENLAVAGTVAVEGNFPFDTGAGNANFLHTPSAVPATSAPITIVNAGDYEVTFTATTAEARQVALFLDGVLIPGSIYGSSAANATITGVVKFTATAGQVLTMRNHTSAGVLTLTTPLGGTAAQDTNSLIIRQLSQSNAIGAVTIVFQNAVTHAPVDDPATVAEVEVVVSVQGLSGGSIAGTLYIQKQYSQES